VKKGSGSWWNNKGNKSRPKSRARKSNGADGKLQQDWSLEACGIDNSRAIVKVAGAVIAGG
jgi:hypothetical protein